MTKRSAGVSAYDAIKEMILKLEIKPGERISESLLTTKFHYSRTPIREALLKLESEGLVQISRNKGASVATYTDAQIRDIATVRLEIDLLAAKLAIHYGSNADFDELEHYALECRKSTESGNLYLRIQSDTDFHMAIARISRNEALLRVIANIYPQVHLIQALKYAGVEDARVRIRHHELLLCALRERNYAAVEKYTCDHLAQFYNLDPVIVGFSQSAYVNQTLLANKE